MKKIFAIAVFAAVAAGPALAQTNVSVSVGQPGFYGQINIGGYPQPTVIYPQPVIIHRAPEYVSAAPVYLHVPPGHEKHWSKHCAEYRACGRPVYFVRDDWYRGEYVPRYNRSHGRGDDGDHGRGHGHDRGHGDDHSGKRHGHDHD